MLGEASPVNPEEVRMKGGVLPKARNSLQIHIRRKIENAVGDRSPLYAARDIAENLGNIGR
jgi:hypothetical protein